MGKVRIELNSPGIRAMLKSEEIQSSVEEQASRIANEAGGDFEVKIASTRAYASVRNKNRRGYENNMRNNTLLRAVHR